ncbi:MAG: biopolymer transporter ExbD [Blastocatellia bacterium]|nr:biopolymer transporter ExbD [Blastocatellia bacterium]
MLQMEKNMLRRSLTVFMLAFVQLWVFLFVIVFGSQPIICSGTWMANPHVYAHVTPRNRVCLLKVQVLPNGYGFSGTQPVSLENLMLEVKPVLATLPTDRRMVTIQAWGGVPYEKVIELVEVLQTAGVTTVDYQMTHQTGANRRK